MTPYEEALRRIAEAKPSNVDLLDLGYLREKLQEVPKEPGELTHLRVLALGSNRPSYDNSGELRWQLHNCG